jgi:hypothetical protein
MHNVLILQVQIGEWMDEGRTNIQSVWTATQTSGIGEKNFVMAQCDSILTTLRPLLLGMNFSALKGLKPWLSTLTV